MAVALNRARETVPCPEQPARSGMRIADAVPPPSVERQPLADRLSGQRHNARMEPVACPDEELMQAYAGGDMAAFVTLHDRHALRVWRYMYRHVGDSATADDLAQDVWLAVVREASRYEVRARFTTWIFTLAHNRMVDHCRGRKMHASLEAENEDGQTLAETLSAPSGYGPLRRIESREQARRLLAALDALPLAQREAFVLQAEAGLSVAEIAQATGVGLETAKSRLRYARSALREHLEGMA